jgi:hypothetical protein
MVADPTNYLAMRIETVNLDYVAVVTRYPQFKEGIDAKLTLDGFANLIVPIPIV